MYKISLFMVALLLIGTNVLLYSQNSSLQQEKPLCPPEEKREFSIKMTDLLKNDKHTEALKVCDFMIQKYPYDYNMLENCTFYKTRIYKLNGQYDKAADALLRLKDLWKEPEFRGIPSDIVVDNHIYGQIIEIYIKMGAFEKAIDACEKQEKAHLMKLKYSKASEEDKILDSIQIGPACYAEIYEKWGKHELARKKYEEEIQWLKKIDKNIDKLPPQYKFSWKFNRDVIYPTKIAELYIKEGKTSEAKTLLLKIKPMADKTDYKKEIPENTVPPNFHDNFANQKKKIDDLLKSLQ